MNCLHHVTYGCTLVTHGTSQRCRQSRTSNHARGLLQRFDSLPDAVDKMVRDCSVSPRQAYRYLQQAGRLKENVPIADAKMAFTVKLSEALVKRLRSYAARRGVRIPQRSCEPCAGGVSAAEEEAWVNGDQVGATRFSWNIGLIVCCRENWNRFMDCWRPTSDGQSKRLRRN